MTTNHMTTNRMTTTANKRTWLVRWMYGVAIGHLAVGLLLPMVIGLPVFDGYHATVAKHFWSSQMSELTMLRAKAEQVWLASLFAATVQAMSLWMLALVHIGAKTKLAQIWLWLIAGLVLWAPQDIYLSVVAGVWVHVWTDLVALLIMLPPLIALYQIDRQRSE